MDQNNRNLLPFNTFENDTSEVEKIFSNQSLFQVNSGYQKQCMCDVLDVQPMQAVQLIQFLQKKYSQSQISFDNRIEFLNKIYSNLILNKSEIIKFLTEDESLSYNFIEQNEFNICVQKLNDYLVEFKNTQLDGNFLKPTGVGVVILSSQQPLRYFIDTVLPALLFGNAVILKQSRYSNNFKKVLNLLFSELNEYNLMLFSITTINLDTLKILMTHPSIKFVVGYGKNQSVKLWLSWLSSVFTQQPKKYQFYSSRNNAAFVIDEQNDDSCEKILDSFYLGNGQLAFNNTRLFILEKHEEFWLGCIQKYLNKLEISQSKNDNFKISPFFKGSQEQSLLYLEQIKKDQGRTILKITDQLNQNVKLNLNIENLPNYFHATQNLSKCSVLQQDESFMPSLILNSVKYSFDMTKNSQVGYLAFSADIWSQSGNISDKFFQGLDVANIHVNHWGIANRNWQPGHKLSSFGGYENKLFNKIYFQKGYLFS